MHELGLAMEIVEIVTARAAGARVTRVIVRVGALAAVLPDQLRFCFELASAGTVAAGAELSIVEEKARGHCRSCELDSDQEHILGRCACGVSDFEWLSGAELKVSQMEVS
jgi:hydrogenase nickel incorporation protein HypA/HybF